MESEDDSMESKDDSMETAYESEYNDIEMGNNIEDDERFCPRLPLNQTNWLHQSDALCPTHHRDVDWPQLVVHWQMPS